MMRVPGFVFATLAGLTLAACQLALGFGDKDFSNGTGGKSSGTSTDHGPSTSSTGGMAGSGTGGHGGKSSGTGGDGGPDADTGVDAGPQRGVWNVHATDSTTNALALVTSIAVSPKTENVFVTGAGDPRSDLGCPEAMTDVDAGVGPNPGYLVELDSKTGTCVWALVFGASAYGTGVAVDPLGNIALTGAYTENAYLDGPWQQPWPDPATSGKTSSFVIVFDSTHGPTWAASFESNVTTTGVAANGQMVAVAGSYLGGNIQVGSPPGSTGSSSTTIITPAGDIEDGFLIWFKATDGTHISDLEVTGDVQSANAVALDGNSDVAATGITQGTTKFNGAATTTPAPGANTIFALAYSMSKTSEFQTFFGGGSKQNGSAVAFDLNSNVLVGGQFTGQVDVAPPNMPDAGPSYTAPSTHNSVIVAQYGLTGTPTAALSLGSATGDVSIGGVAPYNGATVAFAGSFAGMAQIMFGTQAASSVMSMGTNQNVYVAQVDAMLSKVKWLEAYGDGTGDQIVNAVAVDPNDGSIFVAGNYKGTLDFGGMGAPLTNNSGVADIFVAKLKP
jgi:hypothetical protein